MALNNTLYLYSTSHCHLCDDAFKILTKLSYPFTTIEITDSEQMLLAYGTKIPVLRREDTKAELNWPFNAEDVVLFLSD